MRASLTGRLAATWGVLGVIAFLAQALVRLGAIAFEGVAQLTSPLEHIVLAIWVLVMAYAEGWRGFHRRFSPRVVARALVLARDPRPLRALLAPLFCMSLFGASRRGLLVARILLGGIVVLVLFVRMLDQPWRGVVDAGVVVGLGIGTASIGWHAARALRGLPLGVDADVAP